jgi:hypothetical protein
LLLGIVFLYFGHVTDGTSLFVGKDLDDVYMYVELSVDFKNITTMSQATASNPTYKHTSPFVEIIVHWERIEWIRMNLLVLDWTGLDWIICLQIRQMIPLLSTGRNDSKFN